MSYSVEQYARVLRGLLPFGAAWVAEYGSRMHAFLLGSAEEFARVDARGDDLIRESDPRTTLEMLEDWERALGLPDGCLLRTPSAISERRALVTQKAVMLGGQSPAFFINLAALLGYTITITEPRMLRAGFRAGDRAYGVEWAYAWQVNIPIGSVKHFRAGSRAGERVRGWGSLDIECIIARAAPAHTVVLFSYVE